MPARIEYSPGQEVGPHGLKYLNEAVPRVQPSGKKERQGRFLCICNKDFVALISNVRKGSTKSCGCVKLDKLVERSTGENHYNWKCGTKDNPHYHRWSNMNRRCHNPNYKHYPNWGGRGISVHDEWRVDFLAFESYIKSLPDYDKVETENYTLDRIDNDGNYEPGNVKWSSKKEQAANRRPKITNAEHDRVVAELKAEIAEKDALIAELLARKYWD